MRLLKNILAVLLVLMVAVITFYTWNLIFSIVSNYQALTLVSLSGLPLIIFMCVIYALLFATFDYIVLKRHDPYLFRKYSIVVGCFSIVGIVCSIIDGTLIYGTFVGDYVFLAYPLFMLIVFVLLLGISVYFAVISIRKIIQEKNEKPAKISKLYWLREVLVALMLMFALERLGAFVLLPTYFSSFDGAYVIPFYIQLLVPTLCFVSYMVDRHWLHNKKVNIILSSIALGYTLMSLTYMLILANALKEFYPLIVNPLSPILQLERLIKLPIGFIVIYAFSLIYPLTQLCINIVKLIKEKK